MGYTNHDIAVLALNGRTGHTTTGNMSTRNTPAGIFRGGYSEGILPYRLVSILRDRAEHITQIVYSYSTPIAWLDSGVWIRPDVTYSTTTSAKHQSQLYRLSTRSIPWDAGMDEYLAVLEGRTVYTRRYGRAVGTYAATGV